MTARNINTREGYEFWDKLCAIPRYGFIHSPDNSRIIKAEGIGNWIDMHAAQEVVDAAQDEVNGLRAERDQLRAEVEALRGDLSAAASIANQNADHALRLNADVEALRHLAGELYQVLGALDAPAGVLDAVLAAAHGEPMEGRGSLLPFVSDEHETLRKDAERYRLLRRVTIEVHDGSDAEFDAEFDFAIDAALAAKEGA